MSAQVDNAELLSLLESSNVHTSSQVKELIQEQLNSGREAWLVNAVVDSFTESHSVRCLEILAGVNEPHDKHLFDRLSDHWKTGNKIPTLMILGRLVSRRPLWLIRIVHHPLLSSIVKGLKSETDCVTLLTGALAVVSLLPIIPTTVVPLLADVFDVFNRLVVCVHNKSGVVAESYVLHMRVGAHNMFHRLYGMYPCHFLTFLRTVYGRAEHLTIFKDVISPMLAHVRIHPLLVTATKEKELLKERWKEKSVYDVLVECAELSLYVSENAACVDAEPATTSQSTQLLSNDERRRWQSGKSLSLELQSSDAAEPTSVSLPSPPLHMTSTGAGPSAAAGSCDARPAPLVLSSATASDESQSAPVVSSSTGAQDDSSNPPTPLSDPVSSKRQATAFEFSKVMTSSSNCEEWNLDLSGRFSDGGYQQPKLVHISTQTSVPDTEAPAVQLCAPIDRATSTEEGLITRDDSDSSSSPSTSYKTPASVAAFVKKVKRIRFNSITIAKDLPSTGRLNVPRPVCKHATSCPDLLAAAAECGTPSSVSSSQHHFVAGSPAVALRRPSFADPFVVDRISVATQTTMYVHGVESDVVTHLMPYESLIAQTIPFAPLVQCYACLHGGQPIDETKIKPASSVVPYYMTYSESELLDRHLDVSVRLHAARLENDAAAETENAAMTSGSADVLRHELSLLHTHLMFERQRRDVYARRCRGLLARNNQLKSVVDHNEAMRDQLQLQEAEVDKMKQTVLSEQRTNRGLRLSLEQLRDQLELNTRNAENAEESFTSKINSLEMQLQQQKSEKDKVERELELASHELFLKDRDLELLRQKADCATLLQEQVDQRNIELLVMGELHVKYKQTLAEATNLHSSELIKLRTGFQSVAADNNDIRCQLRSKTVDLEAVTAKLADTEHQLRVRDVMIGQLKQLLEDIKKENHKKFQSAETRHRESLLLYQGTILDLQKELVTFHHQDHHAAKGRRLLSAPVLKSPSQSGLAAAAVATGNMETPSWDFPSPDSSAAEGLELEMVTFGQDATDLLDQKSSTPDHS